MGLTTTYLSIDYYNNTNISTSFDKGDKIMYTFK